MGLTKQYLRFTASSVFGIIGSNKMVAIPSKDDRCMVAVAACEHVLIWDMRCMEKQACLYGSNAEVCTLAVRPDGFQLAIGYMDGVVKLFDLLTTESTVVFSGHKSAVCALNYDSNGMRLVSGAKDNQVILWDLVTESGLYRLKGHKGAITQARFLTKHNVLVTSSKDTFVKFWDLDTQHCFKTLTAHRTEVWDFVFLHDESHLVTGCADMNLVVWSLEYDIEKDTPTKKRRLDQSNLPVKKEDAETDGKTLEKDEDDDEGDTLLSCCLMGYVRRHGKGRVAGITVDDRGQMLACHGIDSTVELYKICTEEEIAKLTKKKEKRLRKRKREEPTDDMKKEEEDEAVVIKMEEKIKRTGCVKMSSKIKSLILSTSTATNETKLTVLLVNNTVEVRQLQKDTTTTTVSAAVEDTSLSRFGHRTDVRTLSFSSDSTAILSASADTIKLWNRSSLQCICTAKCDFALCSLFAPGDRHAIVGTKSGKLQLFDLAGASLLENISAHDGAVWSLCLTPDKRGLASGSADHSVKFWDFELVTDEKYSLTRKRLSLEHTRTLKMDEDVLAIRFSPDHRLIAVALLDCTVKVFFVDTLKFFLSLYGHKLPVLSLDICHDSSLLASVSADKNIKLWGLDFGDCHKSIFAHDDSIMCVQFIPQTHMLFTCGKDGKLKQWDADSFDHILTLKGHHSQVWSLAISPDGKYVVSSSHDRSLRLWNKTDEPLVLSDEREMEREEEYEQAAVAEDGARIGAENEETGLATQPTVMTVKAAERLMEALEVHTTQSRKIAEQQAYSKSTGKQLPDVIPHPMMQAYNTATPDKYVLEVIKRIKSSELDECLLVLPFSVVLELLPLLNQFIDNNWQVELCMRAILFLLRIHQTRITSNHALVSVISKLRNTAQQRVNEIRDCVGFNLAGLRHIQRHMQDSEQAVFFVDATKKFKKKNKQKKRAILAVT